MTDIAAAAANAETSETTPAAGRTIPQMESALFGTTPEITPATGSTHMNGAVFRTPQTMLVGGRTILINLECSALFCTPETMLVVKSCALFGDLK